MKAPGLDRPRHGVRLFGEAQIHAIVVHHGRAQQHVGLVGVTRHEDAPFRERPDQRDVLRRLVRAPTRGRVVRRADADEDRADVLMAEIELQHLERPLDDERRVRMGDRPEPRERETTGHADHQLLADPNVDHAIRMTPLRGHKRRPAYLGDDDSNPIVPVDQLGGRFVEAFAHHALGHERHEPCSTTATTACGRRA